jgi:D-sedoheptulose 7-phosphate isomerase
MTVEPKHIRPLAPGDIPARTLVSAVPAPSVSEHAGVHLRLLHDALAALPLHELERLSEALFRAYRNDKQVFTLGNGGSSSTASHMAADLAKNTIGANMHRFRIMCLSDNVSIMTALANDVGYENVFSEQLMSHIRAGDVLLVVSASGNSPNVLKAMRYARSQSAEVAALLGFDGGTAKSLSDIPLVIPSDNYGVVENAHLVINHILVDYFKRRLMASRPWLV